MAFPFFPHTFSCRPGLIPLFAGVFLSLSALIYFFAWNWYSLPAATKFALAGGGTVLCIALALAAEQKAISPGSSLAQFSAAIFSGLFWVVFGQTFQSGTTVRELCLAWAASVVPIFLLRRTASLWNLLVVLLSIGVCSQPLLDSWQNRHTSHFLAPLLTAAAFSAAALLTPAWLHRPRGLNAWFALPVTLLLVEATALCTFCILFLPLQYQPSLPELAAGPIALSAVLAGGLFFRHALTLCETALCGLVLLNAALFRLSETLPATETAALFLIVNGACTFFLASTLTKLPSWTKHPRLRRTLAHLPTIFGAFLSALSLLSLTALFFTGQAFTFALLCAGLLYMPLGTLLWRLRGKSTFVAVLGSVLVSGGSLCFHIGLLDYSSGIILASVWAAASLLYVLLNYAPLRFFSVLWALVSTIAFLPYMVGHTQALVLPVFLLCFLPLMAAATGRFPRYFLRPAAFACIVALPLLFPSFPPLSPLRTDFGTPEEKIAITLASLNLIIMVLRRLPPRSSPSYPRPAELAAAVPVLLALWYLSPLENIVALNLLAAGAGGLRPWPPADDDSPSPSDGILLTLGALTLVTNSVLLYYAPAFSFRTKVFYQGIPGVCLLFSGLWMECNRLNLSRSLQFSEAPTASLLRRSLPFALCAVIIASIFSISVADRLTILRKGKIVLLPLEPQDRQVFMLGDYMNLLYDADRKLPPGLNGPGCLLLDIDENGIATPSTDGFLEGADCQKLSVPALRVEKTALGDTRLRLPRRWYFEGDLGIFYEDAAFAALIFDEKNRILLQGLADDKGTLIHPPRKTPCPKEKSASPSPEGDENAHQAERGR